MGPTSQVATAGGERVGTTDEAEEQTEAAEVASLEITFKEFLETVHPYVERSIGDLWWYANTSLVRLRAPDLRLHCSECDGERSFRCTTYEIRLNLNSPAQKFISYMCGDCQSYSKSFALWIDAVGKNPGTGTVSKYGEKPPFGVPVPNRVLRLFGKDGTIFLKGRQCENQGLGVGAFAYYRRVVENHKNDLFDEIIKACETLRASADLIQELRDAKGENSFAAAMDHIQTALPQALLINGQNPLLALHGALSVGLHNRSDEECLRSAQAVRVVLSNLVEKISFLKQDNKELHDSMHHLLAQRGGD